MEFYWSILVYISQIRHCYYYTLHIVDYYTHLGSYWWFYVFALLLVNKQNTCDNRSELLTTIHAPTSGTNSSERQSHKNIFRPIKNRITGLTENQSEPLVPLYKKGWFDPAGRNDPSRRDRIRLSSSSNIRRGRRNKPPVTSPPAWSSHVVFLNYHACTRYIPERINKWHPKQL